MRVAVSVYFQTGTFVFRPGLFFVEILHILGVPHFFRHGEIGLLLSFSMMWEKSFQKNCPVSRPLYPTKHRNGDKNPNEIFSLIFSLFLCQ